MVHGRHDECLQDAYPIPRGGALLVGSSQDVNLLGQALGAELCGSLGGKTWL
ncbi:hypothetical protein HBI66_067720 [Parastagonospora nodorum]|nr:hypothetical protein HBI66_067720 [Parastagonospora nodorum]